jgi:hypothetical protein
MHRVSTGAVASDKRARPVHHVREAKRPAAALLPARCDCQHGRANQRDKERRILHRVEQGMAEILALFNRGRSLAEVLLSLCAEFNIPQKREFLFAFLAMIVGVCPTGSTASCQRRSRWSATKSRRGCRQRLRANGVAERGCPAPGHNRCPTRRMPIAWTLAASDQRHKGADGRDTEPNAAHVSPSRHRGPFWLGVAACTLQVDQMTITLPQDAVSANFR